MMAHTAQLAVLFIRLTRLFGILKIIICTFHIVAWISMRAVLFLNDEDVRRLFATCRYKKSCTAVAVVWTYAWAEQCHQ